MRKVLVCDDNPLLRALLANAIQESWPNSEILQADNGVDGENLIREHSFDVIFMDLEMPRQNGLVTIRRIRDEGLAEGTPIVLCTGCAGDTELAYPVAMADYRISKPFELETIDEILDRVKWEGYTLI